MVKNMKSLKFKQPGPTSLGCEFTIDGKTVPITSLKIETKAGEIPSVELGFCLHDIKIG